MVWVDIAILVIIGISALISILRGFFKEALSLAAWVIAFWVAFTFTDPLAQLLAPHIQTPSMQMAAAFSILFISTLLLGVLVNYLVGLLVKKTGIDGTDRMLGVIFGVVRGGIIVGVLVLLAGMTPFPKDPWWQESVLLPHFQELAIWMRGFLPPEIASNIVYD